MKKSAEEKPLKGRILKPQDLVDLRDKYDTLTEYVAGQLIEQEAGLTSYEVRLGNTFIPTVMHISDINTLLKRLGEEYYDAGWKGVIVDCYEERGGRPCMYLTDDTSSQAWRDIKINIENQNKNRGNEPVFWEL